MQSLVGFPRRLTISLVGVFCLGGDAWGATTATPVAAPADSADVVHVGSDAATVESLKAWDPAAPKGISVVPPLLDDGSGASASEADRVRDEAIRRRLEAADSANNPHGRVSLLGQTTFSTNGVLSPTTGASMPPLPGDGDPQPLSQPALSGIDRKLWIQKVLVNLDRMRNEAVKQIRQNEETIRTGHNLLAGAKKDASAKTLSSIRQSIATAQETKKKNERNRARADDGIARVKNLLAKMSKESIPVQAFVSRTSGIVYYAHTNGASKAVLDSTRPYLAPGDIIFTGADGQAEIQMLEGAANVTVGPNSHLKVAGDDPAGVFESAKDAVSETVQLAKGKVICVLRKNRSFKTRFDVHTPSAVTSAKGTEYCITVGPDQTTEILVFEGVVEVQRLAGGAPVLVEAGYILRVPKDGPALEPVAVEIGSMNRWWEAE